MVAIIKLSKHEDNMELRIGQYINLLNSCSRPVKAMFPRCVSSYWNCMCCWFNEAYSVHTQGILSLFQEYFHLKLCHLCLGCFHSPLIFLRPLLFFHSPPSKHLLSHPSVLVPHLSLFLSSFLFHPVFHPPLTVLLLLVRQLCSVKETPQHTEEEVGAFTKLIEAMGFTGPLKYNKWVSDGGKGGVNMEEE